MFLSCSKFLKGDAFFGLCLCFQGTNNNKIEVRRRKMVVTGIKKILCFELGSLVLLLFT